MDDDELWPSSNRPRSSSSTVTSAPRRSGSRTSSCRGAAAATSTKARAWDPDSAQLCRRRAQRAARQPPHRGQPPVLLPPASAHVRQRRRVGRVDPAVDGRGGSPRDRDPRLPHGHALDRPARARAGPHAPGVDAARAQPRQPSPTASSTSRCRSSRPASRTATPASCSTIRRATAIMSRVAADENLHHLFYRDLVVGGARDRPVGDGRRDRAPGAHVRDARYRHPDDFKAHARA